MTAPTANVVVVLEGDPNDTVYNLRPEHARRLGLFATVERSHELHLAEGADPHAKLLLPTGMRFTAYELTRLVHQVGDLQTGWEIRSACSALERVTPCTS